jgi:Tfp pilus assembly protein PilV
VSRSADGVWHVRARSRDGGFSLVEVIVALGVLMIVVVALLPQLVVGIRATGTARLVTQAKGVAQGELERIRNLPYYISPDAGDYRDVLDFYYRNLSVPGVSPACTIAGRYAVPQAGWAGYVSETGTRCAYEPATGAFYRTVRPVPAGSGIGSFTLVVNTRFISGDTPPQPVTPRTGYDTQSTLRSEPSSQQVGVTVTALYADRTTLRPVSTSTQIADKPTGTTRVRGEVSVTTLDVGSATTGNGPVSLSAGLLNLTSSLSYASTVKASLSGTSAGLSTGEQASGALSIVAAPPTSVATVKTAGTGSLLTTGCDLACWGSTMLDVPALSADQGLPNAGTAAAPLQALLTDRTNNGVSFGNGVATTYRPELDLAPPMLQLDPSGTATASGVLPGCVSGGTGTSSYVAASGYLRTDLSTAEACGVARASSISLFPTAFAPRGVVLIELRRASARCLVQKASPTVGATYDYEAVVRYWNGTAYSPPFTATPATTTDPLDAVNLATTSVGGSKKLGDYIASWSMLTGTEVVKAQLAGVANVKLPGVVTITSQPVRDGDPTSVVSVTVGALSCSAEDLR